MTGTETETGTKHQIARNLLAGTQKQNPELFGVLYEILKLIISFFLKSGIVFGYKFCSSSWGFFFW